MRNVPPVFAVFSPTISSDMPHFTPMRRTLSSLMKRSVERISSPHRKVTERCGFTVPRCTNSAPTRAISASAPTPDALSLAPGSCTCAEYMNRSCGFVAPRISANNVRSGRRSKRVRTVTCTLTGPRERASLSASRDDLDTKSSQPGINVSRAMPVNWMDVTFLDCWLYSGSFCDTSTPAAPFCIAFRKIDRAFPSASTTFPFTSVTAKSASAPAPTSTTAAVTPSGAVDAELIAIMFRLAGHDCSVAACPTIVMEAPSGVQAMSRIGRDSMRYTRRAEGGAAASST